MSENSMEYGAKLSSEQQQQLLFYDAGSTA